MSTEDAVPAAGTDADSQMRDLKTRLASAESTGDEASAKKLCAELDTLRAAAGRAVAAEGKPDADKTPPAGRTAAPTKSTTAKS